MSSLTSLRTSQELVQLYEGWNTDLRDWWTAQNFLPVSSFTSAPPTSPTLEPDIALTLFRLFASIYINLAAAKETRLADDAARWGFRARSVSAAYEMLGVVGDESTARSVNLLFPFYVKVRAGLESVDRAPQALISFLLADDLSRSGSAARRVWRFGLHQSSLYAGSRYVRLSLETSLSLGPSSIR